MLDLRKFSELMNKVSEYYGKPPLSRGAFELFHEDLNDYPFEIVREALRAHRKHPERGRFMPTTADIEAAIFGATPKPDELIALARLASTPIGIMCRIEIGTDNLKTADAMKLRQIAQQCVEMLPSWQRRIVKGDYTDHEFHMMNKHGVDANRPSGIGLVRPFVDVSARQQLLNQSERQKFLSAPQPKLSDIKKSKAMPAEIKAALAGQSLYLLTQDPKPESRKVAEC